MITELYYGKIEISIDSSLEANFETSIPSTNLNIVNKLKLGSTTTYVFESSKVPFAMRIERIKQFNS
jgi:citrate lyase gamma subunit